MCWVLLLTLFSTDQNNISYGGDAVSVEFAETTLDCQS